MDNTAVVGAGPALSIIDGNGPVWNNNTGTLRRPHKYARPFLVNPMHSSRFSITGVELRDSAFWYGGTAGWLGLSFSRPA